MNGIKTLIAFRHGEYDHNKMIDLEGEAAYAAMEQEPSQDFDYEMDLNDKGKEQAEALRLKLANVAVDACFYSPYLRTRHTAAIALTDHPTHFEPIYDLRERNLGIFRDMPRKVFHEQYADEHKEKQLHPLDWAPEGSGVESLRQVGRRILWILSVLQTDTEKIWEGRTVAFSTHADVMVAMRSLPQLTGLSEEQLRQPLTPELQNPQWIQNCQTDIYTREHPLTGELADEMSFFRSMTTAKTEHEYDTGWLSISH